MKGAKICRGSCGGRNNFGACGQKPCALWKAGEFDLITDFVKVRVFSERIYKAGLFTVFIHSYPQGVDCM